MATPLTFTETTSDIIDSLPLSDGQITFVKDTGKAYRDTSTTRWPFGGLESILISVDEASSAMYITTNDTTYLIISVTDTGDTVVGNTGDPVEIEYLEFSFS